MTHAFKKVTALLLGLTMLGGTFGGTFLAFNDGGTPLRAAETTVTFDFSTISGWGNNNTVVVEQVTLSYDDGRSTPRIQEGQLRIYQDNIFTLSTSGDLIKQVDFTVDPGDDTFSNMSIVSPSPGVSISNKSFISEEGVESITFELGKGGQTRVNSFTVTLSSASPITSISVEDTGFVKEVYAGENWSTAGLTATATREDQSTSDVSNNVTWNFDPATIPTTLGQTTVNVSATLDDVTSNVLPISVEVVEAPKFVTWDLTIASYQSSSASFVTWTSNYVEMVWAKDSGHQVNNYLGNGSDHTHSRIYNSNIFTVNAKEGYGITEVIVTFKGSSDSSGLNGDWTTESGNVTPVKTSGDTVYLTVTPSNACKSVSTKATATTHIIGVEVYYSEIETITPTNAEVTFAEGKGSYYNGSRSNNTFSTADLIVTTKDDEGNIASLYNTGTGFTAIVDGVSLDATTVAQTISFEGETAGNRTITVTVDGLTSNEINLTVIQKDVESFNWEKPQTNTFYSHVDELAIDGVLKTTFNDGSNVTSSSNYAFVVREYDASMPNKAGAEVQLATHSDGTLDVREASKYVLDIWNVNYSTSLHTYVEIDVLLPTLTITDNFSGTYYTNVTRELDVTVTLTAGQTVKPLTKDEYTLTHTSVTPASTDPIHVYPILVKDGQEVMTGTTPLVINPEVSTRVLDELAVDDTTFSAGSYFVLPQESILLSYTDGDTSDLMFVEQENVSFKAANGDVINESTRLLRSHAGQATATYTEGGSEVSCTFTLTVTNAVVAEYVEPTLGDYVKVTSIDELTDGEYLIAYTNASNDNAQVFNGVDSANGNVSTAVNNGVIAHSAEMEAVSVQITAVEGGYSIMINSGENANKFIDSKNGENNGIEFRTSPVALTIQSRGTITRPSSSTGSWDIYRTSDTTLSFNATSDQERFRFFKNMTIATNNNYHAIDLYKRETTEGVGDAINYLKSIIDTYRLNNDLLSICDVDTSIYASADWTRAKEIYTSLDAAQKQQLNVQDYFGEEGKTYIDTYEMLLAKDPAAQDALAPTFFGNEDTTIAVVVVIITLAAITALVGFYYYDKRRRANK